MPAVSSYTRVNNKNAGESVVDVHDSTPESIRRKGVFRYGMILICMLVVCTVAYSCAIYLFAVQTRLENELRDDWHVYKSRYGKNYSQQEDEMRWQIFKAKKEEIDYHNNLFGAGHESYQQEINIFSDFTPEELEKIRGFRGHTQAFTADVYYHPKDEKLPESVDWRLKGAVTGVRNQGACGSCYAFSAAGSLEGQHFLKTGNLVNLSAQNIVDCSEPQGNGGCDGGFMPNSFIYIEMNNGLDTEESYPYKGKKGPCSFQRDTVGATLVGHRTVEPSEAALLAAVASVGPVSAAVDSTSALVSYRTGIFYDKSCRQNIVNHAVLVVGYGSADGQDYWLVKNSWGRYWGEDGYVRMSRNKDNNCGIATMASFPLV